MFPTVVVKFHGLETAYPVNNGTQVNCTVHQGQLEHDGQMYDTVEYEFLYDENIGEGCFFCCPKSTACGYHEGDNEKLILLMQNDKIHHVYFNAHSPGQGCWATWDECEKDENGNLVAFIARGSHALYPRGRTYIRIFGFANDQCSNHGQHMTTNVVGTHTDSIVPKTKSITPTQRFFLPFLVNYLRNRT
jgi:hypothetical protein